MDHFEEVKAKQIVFSKRYGELTTALVLHGVDSARYHEPEQEHLVYKTLAKGMDDENIARIVDEAGEVQKLSVFPWEEISGFSDTYQRSPEEARVWLSDFIEKLLQAYRRQYPDGRPRRPLPSGIRPEDIPEDIGIQIRKEVEERMARRRAARLDGGKKKH